jgi:hypothetical protein
MPLYAAHAPKGPASLAGADRVRLAPQGFSWPAFLFGPLWLIAKGLWRALLVWAAADVLLGVASATFGLGPTPLTLAQFAIGLFLGLEAGALRSAALERSGLPLADIVAAPDEDLALRAFFARWLAQPAPQPAAPTPPAPPSTPIRTTGAASLRQPVIGLFPDSGGRER